MSTSYSKAQLHKAFYAAAEHIERNPKLYNFYSLRVPSPPDCGCAWGWVGAKLGLPERITDNIDVAIACGFPDDSVLPPTDVLYRVMRERGVPYSDAAGAASALRAFADLYYAEQLDTAYAAFKRELLASPPSVLPLPPVRLINPAALTAEEREWMKEAGV